MADKICYSDHDNVFFFFLQMPNCCPTPSLIAVSSSMGIHKVIRLTLFYFPKIIPVFAAVFLMIDSFGDSKAPLLINHCQWVEM